MPGFLLGRLRVWPGGRGEVGTFMSFDLRFKIQELKLAKNKIESLFKNQS
jgi:hypothetical protein